MLTRLELPVLRAFAPVASALFLFASAAPALAGEIPGVYRAWNDNDVGGFATLNGNLTVSVPGNDVSATLDPYGRFQSMQGGVEIHAALTVDLVASAEGAVDVVVPLAAIPLPPIPVNANLVIQPLVGLVGRISGYVEAGAHFAFMEQFETTIDVSFDSSGMGFTLIGSPGLDHQVAAPEVAGAIGSDLEVAIIAGILFEFVVGGIPFGGPTIAAAFSVDLAVDPFANPWWDLDGDLQVVTAWVGPGFIFGVTELVPTTHFDFADAGGTFPGILPTSARWSKSYTVGDTEDVTAVLPLADGFVLVGNAAGVVCREYVAKVDLDGTPVWEQRGQILAFGSMRPSAVATDSGGNLLLAGGTGVNGAGNIGARVEKLDAAGIPIWAQILEEPGGAILYLVDMIEAGDDGVIWAGSVLRSAPPATRHPVVGKIDAAGVPVWTWEFDFGGASTDGRFNDIAATADGGLFLVGTVDYEDQPPPDALVDQKNLFAVKLDSTQSVEFAKVIGTTLWDEGWAACEGADGSLLLGGKCAGEAHAACLVALDAGGAMLWARTYAGEEIAGSAGDTPYDSITRIVARSGGYAVTGSTGLPNAEQDAWMIAVDGDGVVSSFKSCRAGDFDELAGLLPLDEGFIAFGSTKSLDPALPPTTDFWVVRTSVDHYLDFDPAYGFDCWNDAADWGTAPFAALDMPGNLVDLPLTTSPSTQIGFDPITSTVTTLAQ